LKEYKKVKGRKPKPAALRLLTGTPLHKLRPATAAQWPATPLGEPPEWFDPDQAAAWNGARLSAPEGHLTALDRAVMTSYAVAVAAHRAATLDIQRDGRYRANAAGTVTLAPAVRAQAAAAAAVLRTAVELGLTPVSRQRVTLTPPDDDPKPWDKFAQTPGDPAA
jgi:P27 family predicted phage terminase small subunit